MRTKTSVAVIGDGAAAKDSDHYRLAENLGEALIDAGVRIVCGGRKGIMEAVARGARNNPRYTGGDLVGILPTTDKDQASTYIDVVIPTPLGDLRNAVVVQTDVVIAIGGGAGTLSELAFAWMYDRRIIAFRVDGWSGELADRRIDNRTRFDDEQDDRIIGVDTVDEAIDVLHNWLARADDPSTI